MGGHTAKEKREEVRCEPSTWVQPLAFVASLNSYIYSFIHVWIYAFGHLLIKQVSVERQ